MASTNNFTNSAFSFDQLTLANGMTAGIGAEYDRNDDWGRVTSPSGWAGAGASPLASGNGSVLNIWGQAPNFDADSPNPGVSWAPQRLGMMRNIPGSLPGGLLYGLYFQYNPNEINVAWQIDTSQTPPYAYLVGNQDPSNLTYQDGSGNTANYFGSPNGGSATSLATPALLTGQSISWSLIFDRTYDMMYDTNSSYNRGVLKDVAALYNVMGTFQTVGATPMSTPVQVMFGQTGGGAIWGFTGNVTSVNITYGIFRYDMIPSRCEIDLTMSVHYVNPSVPASASSGTTGTPTTNPATSNNNASSATTVTPPSNVPSSLGGPTR